MATKEKNPKPPKPKPKNSCFPPCLGFGRAVSGLKKPPSDIKSRKKRPGWFSWSSFRKRKSGSKTVPVDVAGVVEKAARGADTVAEMGEVTKRVSEKTVGKRQNRGAQVCRDVGEAVAVAEKGDLDKSRKSKIGSGKFPRTEPQNSIPAVESRKPATTAAKDDTCPVPARKTGARPGSPEAEPSRSLTTSSSFPPPSRQKSAQTEGTSRLSARKTGREDDPLAGKLDTTVGISILIVTLAILLLWGRFCAVVCTSAWFYFISRLKTAGKSEKVVENQMDCGKPDIESSEYKKQVVLEGLLERNHRNQVAGTL
eukprot:TRINITY_DN29459_c1_g1_i2.p1 TRINITY_DN29459_c1_g1~~TRINITY_DN29459_c1_g1_i2.p1  ORF type:complete len:312 (+),score=17.94 TRINITY_DN29459_c1_g1_i2:71-1006(+)